MYLSTKRCIEALRVELSDMLSSCFPLCVALTTLPGREKTAMTRVATRTKAGAMASRDTAVRRGAGGRRQWPVEWPQRALSAPPVPAPRATSTLSPPCRLGMPTRRGALRHSLRLLPSLCILVCRPFSPAPTNPLVKILVCSQGWWTYTYSSSSWSAKK